jgi:hypothetical protein
MPQIAFGYGVLALGATVFTVLGARNPHGDTTENDSCGTLPTFDGAVPAFDRPVRRFAKRINHVRP